MINPKSLERYIIPKTEYYLAPYIIKNTVEITNNEGFATSIGHNKHTGWFVLGYRTAISFPVILYVERPDALMEDINESY